MFKTRNKTEYRIIFHQGDSIDLRTRVESGKAELTSDVLRISGARTFEIPLSSLTEAELFRLHGLGRMIRLSSDIGTLFLTVVRLNLWGYFVVVNFRRTGELHQRLEARAAARTLRTP